MLIHLRHSQFFDQQLLNFLKLLHLFIDFLDFVIPFINQAPVIVSLLVFNHPLRLHFPSQKLPLPLINFIPLLPLSIIIILFLSDPPLKQLLLLSDHDPLHAHSPLLLLKFGMPYFLFMQLLQEHILLFLSLNFLLPLLLFGNLGLQVLLMAISSLQEFFGLLIGDFCQLLGPLLLKYKPLNSVLKQVGLGGVVLLEQLYFKHFYSLSHGLPPICVG